MREEVAEAKGRGFDVLRGMWVELDDDWDRLKYRRDVTLGRPMLLR